MTGPRIPPQTGPRIRPLKPLIQPLIQPLKAQTRPLPRPGAPHTLSRLSRRGGGTARFRPWARVLPENTEPARSSCPGREARHTEPFARDGAELPDDAPTALRGLAGRGGTGKGRAARAGGVPGGPAGRRFLAVPAGRRGPGTAAGAGRRGRRPGRHGRGRLARAVHRRGDADPSHRRPLPRLAGPAGSAPAPDGVPRPGVSARPGRGRAGRATRPGAAWRVRDSSSPVRPGCGWPAAWTYG